MVRANVRTVDSSTALFMPRLTLIHFLPHPQCRSVKITILGDEGVPVQVDGEAWIQPPGYIKIIHKNRAQMLTRDRVGYSLKTG